MMNFHPLALGVCSLNRRQKQDRTVLNEWVPNEQFFQSSFLPRDREFHPNRSGNGFALIDVLLALLAVSLAATVLVSTLQAFQRGDQIHVEEQLDTSWYAP